MPSNRWRERSNKVKHLERKGNECWRLEWIEEQCMDSEEVKQLGVAGGVTL